MTPPCFKQPMYTREWVRSRASRRPKRSAGSKKNQFGTDRKAETAHTCTTIRAKRFSGWSLTSKGQPMKAAGAQSTRTSLRQIFHSPCGSHYLAASRCHHRPSHRRQHRTACTQSESRPACRGKHNKGTAKVQRCYDEGERARREERQAKKASGTSCIMQECSLPCTKASQEKECRRSICSFCLLDSPPRREICPEPSQ